jgi:hypothetical protein
VYQFFHVPWLSPRGSLQSRVSSQCNVWPALFASRIFRLLHCLLQRIRSHGFTVAKMDIRASGASTINTLQRGICTAGLSVRRSTVRPSMSFSQTSWAAGRRSQSCYTVMAPCVRSNGRAFRNTAQAMRASLFASATITTLRCIPRQSRPRAGQVDKARS